MKLNLLWTLTLLVPGSFPLWGQAVESQDLGHLPDENPVDHLDEIPPGATDDLSASAVGTTVTLRWTGAGDDDQAGTPALYEVRMAYDPITEDTWAEAAPVAARQKNVSQNARESPKPIVASPYAATAHSSTRPRRPIRFTHHTIAALASRAPHDGAA